MNDQRTELIGAVSRLVKYHLSIGVDSYPDLPQVREFLTQDMSFTREPERYRLSEKIAEPPAPQAPANKGVEQTQEIGVAEIDKGMDGIAEEIRSCSACNLYKDRLVPVVGYGGSRVRLLIVGDWLEVKDVARLPSNTIFGVEQDNMLERMLSAIRISRKEVFITNLIKCGIGPGKQPRAEHVNACSSFLKRQIALLRPELILTMGMISTRTLLSRREPLSRLRGILHSYSCTGIRDIPLVATYHPTFLLANPDMKRATWIDLQLVGRQLGLDG